MRTKMAQQTPSPENSIEPGSLKQFAPEHAPVRTTGRDLWRKFGKAFWAVTEESGKADTKPFEGLL